MYVIRKNPEADDLFDVVAKGSGDIIATKVDLENALTSCQFIRYLDVSLQESVVKHLLEQLSSLRHYEAENYNQQITDMYRDLP